MTFTILLLITLILGAGLIAYVGDVLGRKMGKARLTLFGLRPRHTAVLVTTLTGMLIAAMTLALVLAANRNFRKVLTKGPVILAQNIVLQKSNDELGKQGSQLRGRIEDLQAKATQAEQVYEKARIEMVRAQSQVKTVTAELARARLDQGRLSGQIKLQKGQLLSLNRELGAEQKRLGVAQAERLKAQRIAIQSGQLAVSALTESGIVRSGYQELRETPVVYGVGEEISRSVVERVNTVSEARLSVIQALEQASQKASAKGAASGANGRAVVITPIVIQEPGTTRKLRFDENDSIEAISRELLESRESGVVVVLSRGNSIRAEQVPVELKLFRSRVALSKGDVLACVTLSTDTSEVDLSARIRQFLAGPVREGAQQAGIIPRAKASGDPAFFDLDVDRLAQLVAQAKNTGDTVRVCARAHSDTSTAGPLDLDFTMEKR